MANHVRYIRRRSNGVFYYERRVPQAILERKSEWQAHFGGATLFRKSLGTRRQADALSAGASAHHDFETRVILALGRSLVAPEEDDNATRPLTPTLLEKIARQVREIVVRPWVQRAILTELGGIHAAEFEAAIQTREFDAQELRSILTERKVSSDPRMPNIEDQADHLITQERLDAPVGSTQRALVVRAVREGLIAGHGEIDDILAGKQALSPTRLESRRLRAPTISQAVADYIGQLRARRTIREVQGALEAFVEIVGDLPLDEITRADVVLFCQTEGRRTIGGKTSGSIVRPVAPETLKKKIGLLRTAINHAIKTDRYVGVNPTANIDAKRFTKAVPKAVMPDKRPFNVHELQLILQHPWFTGCKSPAHIHTAGVHRLTGMHYWVPILAMHTGCRAGELGGLRVSEVRLNHTHPHLVIQDNVYRTTKGAYRRNIPILDVLLEHGFAEFVSRVSEAGHDRLFHDWAAPAGKVDASDPLWSNGSIIRAFNRTLVRQQLGSLLNEGARQEVTFHGFRGAFKTLLGRPEYGLPENYKHEVIGHAKSALDKRYIQEIPLEDTYPAMRQCKYAGLVLPLAPPIG